MQKIDVRKIIIKLTKNWKFVVFVCLVICGTNLYLIQRRLLHVQPFTQQEVPLFKTYKVTGNCFYQIKDSLKWLFLSGEEYIYPGSQIQSDESSHVILSFVNQSGKVELAEKTLGYFYQSEKETVVEFKKGEMFVSYQSANVQKGILVKVGNRIFKFANADLFITGDVEGVVSVSVEYGRISMEQDGLVNNFEKGQSITFREGREFHVMDSKFSMSTPLNYDRYSQDIEDKVSVRFAFAKFDKPMLYQLYVGESPDTLKEFFSKNQDFPTNDFSIKLPKGSYYWQLAAFEKNMSKPLFFSPLKRFFIEPKISIQPILPLANAEIPFLNGSAEIQFQWDNPSQLERIYIEVSEHKNFKNLVLHENVLNNNFYNAKISKVGTYYWRVSGFPFGTSDYLTGPSKKFTVKEGDVDGKLDLIFPPSNAVLTVLSLKNSDVTFQWSSSSKIHRYNLVFINKKNKEVKQVQSDEMSMKIVDLEPGEYTWFVQDAENAQVESVKNNFVVLNSKKIEFKEAKERGTLNWEKGPKGTSNYRVEVMKIGSRSNFNEFFNPKSRFKTSLSVKKEQVNYKSFSEGIYAFKIYAVDKNKKILGDTSLKFLKVDKL